MYQGLVHTHNILRWVILILAVIAIVKAYAGMTSRKPFTNGDKKTGLFLMISAHLTLLIGILLWLLGPLGLKNIQNSGMAAVMKDAFSRYWAVEHFVGMLIGVILITIGRRESKKNIAERIKHQRTFLIYLVALLIILATVPWPFRENIGRPWFPGMH